MTDSAPPGVFVERILDYVVADTPSRTVTVRIYQPVEQGPEEWTARVEISGLESPFDHSFTGTDGVMALFEALRMAGAVLDRHPGLSWGNCKPWEPVGFGTSAEMVL
jgi:hypothetical protein